MFPQRESPIRLFADVGIPGGISAMAAENFKIHYDQEDEYNASTFYSQHTLDLRPDGTCTLMYVYHYDDTHGQGFFKPRFVDEMYAQLFRNERGRYTYLELEWTGTYYIASPKELVLLLDRRRRYFSNVQPDKASEVREGDWHGDTHNANRFLFYACDVQVLCERQMDLAPIRPIAVVGTLEEADTEQELVRRVTPVTIVEVGSEDLVVPRKRAIGRQLPALRAESADKQLAKDIAAGVAQIPVADAKERKEIVRNRFKGAMGFLQRGIGGQSVVPPSDEQEMGGDNKDEDSDKNER